MCQTQFFTFTPYRKFLREGMPRLQYNNPNVEFAIIRSTDPQTAPVVTVHFGKTYTSIAYETTTANFCWCVRR